MKISKYRRSVEHFERKNKITVLFGLSIIILLLGCAVIMCRTFELRNSGVWAESSATQTSGSAVKYEADGQAAVYYDTLEEAVVAVNAEPAEESNPYYATLTLLKDLTLSSSLAFNAAYHYITLDINGFAVNFNSRNITIGSSSTTDTEITDIRLTLKDSDPTQSNTVNVNSQNITFDGGVLYNGKASSGGAINMYRGANKLVINGLNFVGCSSTSQYGGGGAIYAGNGTVEISGTEFSYNSASYQGGAIFGYGTAITLDNVILENNSAADNGGAIRLGGTSSAGSVKLNNTTIRNNSAKNGGGLSFDSYIDLEIRDTEIYKNTASETAGGIYLQQLLKKLVFENATVRENKAKNGGGIGLHVVRGLDDATGDYITAEIPTGISIYQNTATTNGGGVYVSAGTPTGSAQNNSDVRFLGISITDNYAGNNGGGIAIAANSYVTSYGDTKIERNKCGAFGGGIAIAGSSTSENAKSVFTMLDGTISGNISGDEATAYYSSGGAGVNLSMKNSIFNLYGGSIVENVSKFTDNNKPTFYYHGSGINNNVRGTINVHGSPVVRNNITIAYVKNGSEYTKSRSCADNFCISYGYGATYWTGITVDGALTDGAYLCLGVYEEQTKYGSDYIGVEKVFTAGYAEHNPSADPALYFYCDVDGMITVKNAAGEAEFTAIAAEVIVNDQSTLYNDIFEAFDDAKTAGTAIVKLRSNISISQAITIDKKSFITLDLNGYILRQTGDYYAIYVFMQENDEMKALFTITDSRPDVHNSITVSCWEKDDDSFASKSHTYNFSGGAIAGAFESYTQDSGKSGAGSGLFIQNSVAKMTGGNIIGNKSYGKAWGGGVTVYTQPGSVATETQSKFYLEGGSISYNIGYGSDNESDSTAGGVFVMANCEFIMTGGSINNNEAYGGNGGVSGQSVSASSNRYGSIKLLGGEISGNIAHESHKGYNVTSVVGGARHITSVGGNIKIKNNFNDMNGVTENLRLSTNETLVVETALVSGAKIGVTVDFPSSSPPAFIAFTSGFKEKNGNADAHSYFVSDDANMTIVTSKDGEAQILRSKPEFVSFNVTDNKGGNYISGEKVDITVTATFKASDDAMYNVTLTPDDYTVAYSSGQDCLAVGSNTVTVTYIHDGITEQKSITITTNKQKINLADENVYKWTLDGYGSELRSGRIYVYIVNGVKQYYSSAQTGLGDPTILDLTRSIVRFRDKELIVNLNNGNIPQLPGGGARSRVSYTNNYGTNIGVYTTTATLTLLDTVNFEYISQGLDASRNMTIEILDNGKTAVITKTWYIVYIDNGLLSQNGSSYGREYSVSDWTYGDDVTIYSPRLEHGDEGEHNGTLAFNDATDRRVSFKLMLEGEQIGETFYRYNFDRFVNKTMPAGRYVLKVSVERVTLSDGAHTHWWNGESHAADDGGLSYQPFTREFDFTVEKAVMSVSGGLRNSSFEYTYDGDLHLYSNEKTPTASLAYADAADRLGIWATDDHSDYYSSKLVIGFNLKRWNNAEYRSVAQLGQMSDNGSKPVNAGEYTVYYRITAQNYEVYGGTDSYKFTVLINKAVYDMSGVAFENKTVIYDGSAHSIEITGALPNGVSVTYIDNGKTEVGTYTVTAKFTVADPVNYEAIREMTATLKIDAASSVDPEQPPTKPDLDTDSESGSEEGGSLWWIGLVAGVAIVAVAVAVALIVVKKKHKH